MALRSLLTTKLLRGHTIVVSLRSGFRLFTPLIRFIPSFVIIGAMKCGTGSLFDYLIRHPCVVSPHQKEIHFFDLNYQRGFGWYRSHFPLRLRRFFVSPTYMYRIVAGEASPYYVFHPLVPQRLFGKLPHTKLILLLRNPVDRAYSHYNHEVRKGRESLSFETAIHKEKDRLYGEEEKILRDEDYCSLGHQHYSYLARGIYIDQVKAWMKFFPKEQLLIIKSEDFFRDPATTYNNVLKFLDLPSYQLENYGRQNVGGYSQKMDIHMRKQLLDYFEPHNQRLYDYLNWDLGWNE